MGAIPRTDAPLLIVRHSSGLHTSVADGVHGALVSFPDVVAAESGDDKILQLSFRAYAEFVYDGNDKVWRLRTYAQSTDGELRFEGEPPPAEESIERFEQAMTEIEEHGR